MPGPIFIHIPRTGGNSVIQQLSDKNIPIIHHVYKVDLGKFVDDWKFTFMRDPCSRVVSTYSYLKAGGLSEEDSLDADKYVRPFSSFEEFVFNGLKKASEEQRHFRPQSYWIRDNNGKIVTQFIGRTERLQTDFDKVCDACGWPKSQLGIVNASKHEGIACTVEMRQHIMRIYSDDCSVLLDAEGAVMGGLMGRILSVFRKNQATETRDVIWEICFSEAKKTELNEPNLMNMCQTTLVAGFGGGDGRGKVVNLAEALGISGIQNPEANAHHGGPFPARSNVDNLSIDDVLDRIQERIPFKIKFPEFNGNCLQGFHTSRHGTITNRFIQYVWAMKRIMELCPDKNSSVIEIGAGFGVLGYFMELAGYTDYTVIDLSLVQACQTYFLSKNLPHRKLILSGEVPDPFSERHSNAIKLLHANDFKNVPKGRFSIMFNMDGFTEYGIEQATRYVQSDCAKMLLSVNHEVNLFRVCEIDQPLRKRAYRYPFWLRSGYVEELYVPK
jgi:hypothetical protein